MKRLIIFMLAIIATCALCFGSVVMASAAEIEPLEEPYASENEAAETDETTIAEIASGFVEWLKKQYGDNYQSYYDSIIETWGSIEGYLLQFGDEYVPDRYEAGWDNFIGALSSSAPVWGSVLAVCIVALVVVFVFARYKRLKMIETELNKQSKAQIAQINAIRALLGTQEKFATERDALDQAQNELAQ